MLTVYEQYDLPELVYFAYIIGVRLKRTYDIANVSVDLLNKLIYYFSAENRNFNEIISFTNVMDNILDMTYISPTDTFSQCKGIQTLVIREVLVKNRNVYEPNTVGNYPYYTTSTVVGYNNNLRHIQLGHNQFPMLDSANVIIVEET